MARRGLLAGIVALALTAPLLATPIARAACDPLAVPTYRGQVPSPEDVLGFPIGS